MMKIVHISDTHGARQHSKLVIPECDLLLHTGDIGGRTSVLELIEFIEWFDKQPAECKIFIAGNHDIALDKNFIDNLDSELMVNIFKQNLEQVNRILSNLPKSIHYLNNTDYVYKGIKIYGSPYSPSFHRNHWAFNADRGNEIKSIWGRIPHDIDILLTHTPPMGILDLIPDEYVRENETNHVGCDDINNIIKKNLTTLKLHCFGHIHNNYGIIQKDVSRTRRVLFSNGAILNNEYELLITKPLIITI